METRSAIRQRTRNDTAAETGPAQPPTALRCKHCGCEFATMSEEGSLNASIPHELACASCKPFLGLYVTLKTREQEHAALLDRGPKHHGRILAHERVRKATVELGNFLVGIEAPHDTSFDAAGAGFANRIEPVSLEHTREPAEVRKRTGDLNSPEGASPPIDGSSPAAASHIIKRGFAHHHGVSNLERKRIKFCEDAQERSEYRKTLEYYRGTKEYIPGRYAVTLGSEYEDTSGSTMSFAKFTGQKKVGSKFVDIVPKEKTQDGVKGIPAPNKRGKGRDPKSLGLTNRPDTPNQDEGQMNNRHLSFSQRHRSTTPSATVEPRGIFAQHDEQEDRTTKGENDVHPLGVVLETPNLSETHTLTNSDQSGPASEQKGGSERLSHTAETNQVALEVTKPTSISQIVLNIQCELRSLQRTTVAPKYMDVVAEAVRGCYEALGPLQDLDCVHLLQSDEVTSPQEEEGSIYFDTNDGTSKPTLIDVPQHASHQSKNIPKRNEATFHNGDSGKFDISLALDANLLDDVPTDDRQVRLWISELGKSDNNGTNTDLLAVPLGTVEETNMQTETDGATRVGSKRKIPVATL